jgi:hypothetical protein
VNSKKMTVPCLRSISRPQALLPIVAALLMMHSFACAQENAVLVNGYDEILSMPYDIQYHGYKLRQEKGAILYQDTAYVYGQYAKPPVDKPYEIKWQSAAIPAKVDKDARVVLVWSAVTSGYYNPFLRGKHELPMQWGLYLGEDDKPLIVFETGLSGTTTWRNRERGSSLTFLADGDTTQSDVRGIMKLDVPASMVKAGDPVVMRVKPLRKVPVRAMYIMLFDKDVATYFAAHSLRDIAPGLPLIEGYQQERVSPFLMYYLSYRRAQDHNLGLLVYTSSRFAVYNGDSRPNYPRHISWETAPVPDDADDGIVLVWSCAMSGAENDNIKNNADLPFSMDLCIGSEKINRLLTFNVGVKGDTTWEQGDVTLRFRQVAADEWGDIAGLMYLKLPARMLKAGEPVFLTVRPHEVGVKAYYAVYRDDALLMPY